MLSVMVNVVILSVIILSDMVNIFMPSVIMQNVVLLSVVAPFSSNLTINFRITVTDKRNLPCF